MYTPNGNLELLDSEWRKNAYDSLPGFMTTAQGSNNSKLLDIITDLGNVYKNDMLRLTDQMNVNTAKGQLLTDIAKDFGIDRIDNDDDFLRFEVKMEMWKEHLGPGFNSIKKFISYLFNIDEKDFSIISTGLKSIKITNLPFNFDSGSNETLKRNIVGKMLRSILPSEYQLKEVAYQESTEIWLYQGIESPKSPIYESVQQYVSGLEVDANTWFLHRGWRARSHNVSQQLPTINEDVSAQFNIHHAKRFKYIKATQNRKDQ